ncbi:MAG: MerR family transcriptional regulator [Mycobacterium sp.]
MTDDDQKPGVPASDRGVFGISVAVELSGIDEQSLRLYERRGLLTPARTRGGTRRYSAYDLVVLKRIRELADAGVNIAGIARIVALEDRNVALGDRNVILEGDNAALRAADTRHRKSRKRAAASPNADTDSGQHTPAK